VVAIDADAGLRNLDLLLGLENRVHLTAADVLAGDCRLDQALIRHRSLQGLHLLCLSKPRSKLPLAFGSKTLTWVADALRRSASPPAFILIDCPAGQASPSPAYPYCNWFISN
jgi:septum site-determining protein MinD